MGQEHLVLQDQYLGTLVQHPKVGGDAIGEFTLPDHIEEVKVGFIH